MRGLPMPLTRVPPTPEGRAYSTARAQERIAVILRDLDLPAAPWQIVLAARLFQDDDIATLALTGLTRALYTDVAEIVDDLIANKALLEILLLPGDGTT